MRTTLIRTAGVALTATKSSAPTSSTLRLPLAVPTSLQKRSEATLTANAPTSNLQHAISNPTLASIEKRWETMPPAEQAELWMALRKRMKIENWNDMTLQEKKAAYYIAFGPHGPRASDPPGENLRVLGWSAVGLAVSFVLFCIIRYFARPPPKTMTKEWEEKTNEYLKSQNSEPITGISSPGYSGKGYVQSAPAKKQ